MKLTLRKGVPETLHPGDNVDIDLTEILLLKDLPIFLQFYVIDRQGRPRWEPTSICPSANGKLPNSIEAITEQTEQVGQPGTYCLVLIIFPGGGGAPVFYKSEPFEVLP